MLGDEDVCERGRRSSGFLHRGEDVSLLEFLLVILLSEGAKELCSFLQRIGRNRSGRQAEFCCGLAVDDQRTPQHSVLSHQVFGCSDLASCLFLFLLALLRRWRLSL